MAPDRWPDLEALFGVRGACGGCWCMYWRQTHAEHAAMKGEPNRAALREIVASGRVPGIIAYAGDIPAGWCAVEPRSSYPTLDRSRILKPVDNEPVWSITCLFVAKQFRRQGLTVRLLRGAAEHAAAHGARIVEGYPVEPASPNVPPPFAWTGIASAFERAGFHEVARRSPTRPIMRRGMSDE